MRLVLIVPRFPRVSETFIVNKFVGLADAGWDVHIACRESDDKLWANFPPLAGRSELRKRVHTQPRHEPRWVVLLLWLPVFLLTFFRAPRTTWQYWRAMWPKFGATTIKSFYLDATVISLRPDIIHFEFGTLAVERLHLKKALNCYMSVSFRGYDLSYVGLETPDFYGALWESVDAIHVLGHDLWQRALRRGCPPNKPHMFISPAIDATLFAPERAGHETPVIDDQRPLRILSVGRLTWVKGYEYALNAVRLLQERGVPFEYRIIGGGDYLEPLAFMRHEMGLDEQVEFLGARPPAAVIKEMNWADVFLHAAVSEGFCNAVMEAQAMCLPVVASDADGLRENLRDGETGFVVPRRDPEALFDKLITLAQDAALRQKMGVAGRRRVEECFTLPRQIAAFDHFFREVVAAHAH